MKKSNKTNKFSLEIRERAVLLALHYNISLSTAAP